MTVRRIFAVVTLAAATSFGLLTAVAHAEDIGKCKKCIEALDRTTRSTLETRSQPMPTVRVSTDLGTTKPLKPKPPKVIGEKGIVGEKGSR